MLRYIIRRNIYPSSPIIYPRFHLPIKLISFPIVTTVNNNIPQQQQLPYSDANPYKYSKQIAKYLKINMPDINAELQLNQESKYWLVGYRKIQSIPTIITTTTRSQTEIQTTSKQQHQLQEQLQYIPDPLHRQQITYVELIRLSQSYNLDIFLINRQNNQVSLSNIQQRIYRKYYYQQIYKKNSLAKKYKEMRIPQNIQYHDLLTKYNKIKGMIQRGHNKIRLVSENQSIKCETNIKKLCELLEKDTDEITIQEEIIRQKSKKGPKITVERYIALLNFQQETKISYQKINKKWRRKNISEQIKLKKPDRNLSNYLDGLLEHQSLDIQRQMLHQLRKTKAPLPKAFQDYGIMQDSLEEGPLNFYKQSFDKLGKDQPQNQNQNQEQNQQQQQQQQEQQQYELPQKQNRKYLNIRTVSDILEDMQQIRGDNNELDAFQTHKMKILEHELKQALDRARSQSSPKI